MRRPHLQSSDPLSPDHDRVNRTASLRSSGIEIRQAIGASNGTDQPYPPGNLVHVLFEEQVLRTPDAIAVTYGHQSLTYSELNARANQVALQLRSRGVVPDTLVPLCVARSVEMVVGLLAILKAGGAYVPLDPNYPQDRLRQILEDIEPLVVLTHAPARAALPQTAADVVFLDGHRNELTVPQVGNFDPAVVGLCSGHLAYAIYTSGSTGRPKGVMVQHSNVLSLAHGIEHIYRRTDGCQRVAVNASFTFDASVKQFIQLLRGRTLVMVPQEARWDAPRLLRFLSDNRIDCIDCTPWQLKSWLSAGLLEGVGGYRPRLVLIGGEAIDPTLWGVLAMCGDVEFYNLYGPTECTVDATCTHVREGDGGPHIGSAMAHRQVYILDREGKHVPSGSTGEMYIAGAGVARGYVRRPDLTAERFLPDPMTGPSSGRMYRTGDLARRRADGNIEYLGRSDHQVKIRGHRIELGEIEACLAHYPEIKDAVVEPRPDASGGLALVAYVVATRASALDARDLRSWIKKHLPEYMVPSAYVMLERMPLTANGKLDRRMLPAPSPDSYVHRPFEAPLGQREQELAEIWQSLLRVDQIGRQDNFFELGGHSMVVMELMSRLRQIGLTTDVRRVFEASSLAELALSLQSADPELTRASSMIPEHCANINPEMLPLLNLKLSDIEWIAGQVPGGARNIQDIYPLAPSQEGILFHHRFNDGGGDTYVVPMVLEVETRARLDALIAAVQAVIDRHQVLRTAILWERLPSAVQVVYRNAVLPVHEVQLNPQRDASEQALAWAALEHQRIDLAVAPLLRFQVAEDANSGKWFVLFQHHHIVSDHITIEIVTSEILAHLREASPLLPQSVPYRDHVAQAMANSISRDDEAFFREKLHAVDEPTASFGLLDVRGSGAQVREWKEDMDGALARMVRSAAARLGVSAATLFHAAWSLLVAHTSGRDDVVFGTVLLGRMQAGANAGRMLGMFINTLPLRIRLTTLSARELIEHTQRELIDLLVHEQASLALAQRCSAIASSAPLFNAVLNYAHGPTTAQADWSSVDGIRVLSSQERTNYPLVLWVEDLGERFELIAQTSHGLDPRRIAAYMSEAMRSLTRALAESPSTLALSLSILPADERKQVLQSSGLAQTFVPPHPLIHGMFEEQVHRTPDATALVYGERRITYAELNSKANQLAHLLIAHGVRSDQCVALYVDRGVEMVVGLLGILKAGAAYLPLDINYPIDRIRYMLRDATPAAIVTQPSTNHELLDDDGPLFCIGDECHIGDASSQTNPDALGLGLHANNLAYIIYTSGSTGAPKGVAVAHAEMVRLIHWHRAAFSIAEGTCCSAVAAIGFDAATWEICTSMTLGATLMVAPSAVIGDAEAFIDWWVRQPLDVSFLPTPMAELVLSRGVRHPRLCALLIGGDRLSSRPKPASFALVNNYGPTECTVVATSGRVDPDDTVLHIGRPVANASVRILDRSLRPVPIGVAGEIHIGGGCVARGYLNRPELTAQRFIADPFGVHPYSRMYRTGDLARWRADGTVEFLGRNDEQIKVRGYRIELGEIQAQLAGHEQVGEVIVVSREDVPGQERVVAYFTRRDEAAVDVEALRVHAKQMLPDYMVPSAFVEMERLPLTANGKVDRKALPQPDLSAFATRLYQAPQGEAELALARIWQDLLQIQRVGRNDDFFDIGGHSLLAMQVATRIRTELSVQVPLRSLFEQPTLKDLAAYVDEMRHDRLLGILAANDEDIEGLLQSVALMPESEVQELVRTLNKETRS